MTAIEPSPGPAPLVIFDVCDTLYDGNTTVGFLRHFGARSPKVAAAAARWTSRRSPFFYLGAASHRLLGVDIARRRLVATLRGETRQALERAAEDYVERALAPAANAALHDRLGEHRSAGHRTVLLSNGLDIVVAPIAKALGVEFRASRLGFEGNSCTGRIESDLAGRKAVALRELVGAEASPIWVYTDNRSDRDILALADKPTIVLPRRGEQREWGESGCDYIRL